MGVFKGYQPNIFRAVSGSLFSTAANWSRGYVPTGSDVATIADNCVIDVSRTLGSLVVRAPFTASVNTGLILYVSQSFLVKGHMNFLGAATIFLSGKYNEINGINPGTSTFFYRGETEQLLPGGPYYNLQTSYYDGVRAIATTKKSTSNLVINGSLQINYGTLELGKYDYYCSGSTLINGGLYGILSKNQPGNIIFNGSLRNTAAGYTNNFINFSNGNPTIEVRNGIDIYQYPIVNTGKGTWRFTTNNQNIFNTAGGRTITFDGPVSIENVTLSMTANSSAIILNDVINGTTVTSQLLNSGSIYFNSIASLNSMTTGTFDYTSSNNTIGFTGNYSATIPTRYANLRNLYIDGSGVKSLGTSSYISSSLTTAAGSTLELAGYNLIVSGATTAESLLSKTGSGNIVFGGNAYVPYISLTGNPTVEFKNGVRFSSAPLVYLGTGSISFTTSSQTIQVLYNPAILYGSSSIGPGVTLTQESLYGGRLIISGSLTGADATSRFYNKQGGLYFANKNSFTVSPATYDFTSSVNSEIGYIMSESITIPDTNYMNLYIEGVGKKFLSGNTLISGSLSVIGTPNPTTLEIGNYDLTVVGNMYAAYSAYISKTGPGTVTFGGTSANAGFTFTGHPTVIFKTRGPIGQFNYNYTYGSGSYIFAGDCNPYAGYNETVFLGSVIISGSVSASFTGVYGGGFIFSGSVNGTSASSIFVAGVNAVNNAGSKIRFSNPEAPMITGNLWANTLVPNDVQYDYVGPLTQSIQVPTDLTNPGYYNLYLTGSTKKLLGNISVKGILSTGSTKIDFNGFTLTNP